MKTQAPGRTDWFYRLLAIYTALHLVLGAALLADFFVHPLAPAPLSQGVAIRWVLALGLMPAGLIVSVLVLRRAPGNLSGLCLLLHCVLVLGATLRAGSPLEPYNAALNTAWSGLWILGLYFPDGRPQPARYGSVIRSLSALSLFSNAAWSFFQKEFSLASGKTVPNPLFVEGIGPLAGLADAVQQWLLLAVALMIPLSLFIRYRQSDVRGRLQLKWLLWPFVLLILGSLPLWIAALLTGGNDPFASLGRLPVMVVALYIYVFPFAAVGTAILRHRLYDIDVVIRRTLVYSVLTGLLASIYFGSVVVIEGLLRGVTGGQSPIAIVLSTLLIAALFVPLRSRVQRGIDRRFYRRKYDTVKTLAAFGMAARDEVDLDRLNTQLRQTVEDTMQPASVGLWLRGKPK